MAQKQEQNWLDGNKSAYTKMLHNCLRELGSEDITKEKLILELQQTRLALRSLCEDFGDNDWDDRLYLPDVVNKHLGRNLYRNINNKNK